MACLFFETGMPFKKENQMRMFKYYLLPVGGINLAHT